MGPSSPFAAAAAPLLLLLLARPAHGVGDGALYATTSLVLVRVGDGFATLDVDAGSEEPFISDGAREVLDKPVE